MFFSFVSAEKHQNCSRSSKCHETPHLCHINQSWGCKTEIYKHEKLCIIKWEKQSVRQMIPGSTSWPPHWPPPHTHTARKTWTSHKPSVDSLTPTTNWALHHQHALFYINPTHQDKLQTRTHTHTCDHMVALSSLSVSFTRFDSYWSAEKRQCWCLLL